jgi:hypothetical protein
MKRGTENMGIIYEVIEKKLIEKIPNDTISNIEDFLGYQIKDVMINDLDDKIREVLCQMLGEEIIKYARKYRILRFPERL